jgi:uncharacterized membrane protein YbhN (UPF0104 family)
MQTKPSQLTGERFRLWYSLIFIFIAGGILSYLLYSQREILINYDWNIDWIQVLFSFVIFSLDLLLVVIVWAWIMNSMGKKLKLSTHFIYYSLSNILKRIPGTIWYIAGRAQFYKFDEISGKLTSVASGIEYSISVLSSIFVSILFAIPIISRYSYSPYLFVLVIIIGGVMIHPRVISWILSKLKVESEALEYRLIIKSLFTYLVVWILGGLVLFFIANSIYPLQLSDLAYVVGSWSFVGFISSILLLSPSNLGLTEVGLSLLLATIMPSSFAVIVAIMSRILITIYELFWASYSFFARRSKLTQKD